MAAGSIQNIPQVSAGTLTVTWSSPTAVEQVPGIDILPDAVQASNGTLWLAWESDRFAGLTARTDILYKTMTGGAWSPTYNFTSSGYNASPALAQLPNGTIFLFWAALAGNYDIFYKRFSNGGWSDSVQLTTSLGNDTLPAASVGRDGTLWLVWTRITASCTITPCRQLYYKTLRNGVWAGEVQLTTDATWNMLPSVTVAKDGRVWVVWSKWISKGTNWQIFYKIFNGSGWGPDTQVVSSNNWELHPAILQDRNGTLWIFWAREQSAPQNQFQDDIFSKYSIDNGVTWSSDAQMTFDPSCCLIDDNMPAAVQGSDRSIWLFYASDLTGGGADFDIYYLKSSPIYPVHDVTVSAIKTLSSLQYPGGLKSVGQSPVMTVNVTVADPGDFNESVRVTLTAFNSTNILVGTLTGSVVARGSVVISFGWNTTGLKPGWYSFLAAVGPVPGETIGDSGDNSLVVQKLVRILPIGDVNQDGKVDFFDLLILAAAYGSSPGSSHWNPYCDINGNGTVDFLDLLALAADYGTTT